MCEIRGADHPGTVTYDTSVPERYDADYVAAFYDRLGEREWDRHDANWSAKFAYRIHCHYLQRFVHAGDLILEVGAGPGRKFSGHSRPSSG